MDEELSKKLNSISNRQITILFLLFCIVFILGSNSYSRNQNAENTNAKIERLKAIIKAKRGKQ